MSGRCHSHEVSSAGLASSSSDLQNATAHATLLLLEIRTSAVGNPADSASIIHLNNRYRQSNIIGVMVDLNVDRIFDKFNWRKLPDGWIRRKGFIRLFMHSESHNLRCMTFRAWASVASDCNFDVSTLPSVWRKGSRDQPDFTAFAEQKGELEPVAFGISQYRRTALSRGGSECLLGSY